MYNYQKIAKLIIDNFPEGKILSHGEIVDFVMKNSSIPKGSIMPYDLCFNHDNLDPNSGKRHVFQCLDEGIYKVLNHEHIKESCMLNKF